uniref:Uncharacterized protein n=1 Tax=Rhizophora mucronata TaxID=61149 RepID=A0A2P2QVS5_RHIMU
MIYFKQFHVNNDNHTCVPMCDVLELPRPMFSLIPSEYIYFCNFK